MISDNLRERYNLDKNLSLPTFFLDCKYDEEDEEEKTAFTASFENILISAKMKEPYYLQGATAVPLLIAKLEWENRQLKEEKEYLNQRA